MAGQLLHLAHAFPPPLLPFPHQIVLLGVCSSRRPGAAAGLTGSNDSDDLTLQPLPMYSVPSDNVVMTCVATTWVHRQPREGTG
jgi:hypothetical protein